MKAILLVSVSCFLMLFSNFVFAARHNYAPAYSENYRVACNHCNVDFADESCDSCGAYSEEISQESCDMSYYNNRTPFIFSTSCNCTDPNAVSNPCLNCGEFCHVFGNIGGRNYESIYCCGGCC